MSEGGAVERISSNLRGLGRLGEWKSDEMEHFVGGYACSICLYTFLSGFSVELKLES